MPDEMWVNIMSYLPVSDRGRLAQTCRALKRPFSDPRLWKTVKIALNNFDHSGYAHEEYDEYDYVHDVMECKGLPICDATSYLPMIERFGKYFQNLTIIFFGIWPGPMERDCEDVIQCITTHCCRYEILTLDVQIDGCTMCPTDLNILAKLFTLQLKSFTLFGMTYIDLRVLLSNVKLHGCLERLSLYWRGEGNRWQFPSPDETLAVASRFTQLRALYLHSSMISNDLIVNLYDRGRPPLQELGIMMYVENWMPNGGLPHIEANSWIRLRTHSPCLQVHVKNICMIPDDKLFDFLRPEIQVASITSSDDRPNGRPIIYADRFSSTLQKYVEFSHYSSGEDAEIVYMVTKCIHLVHLEYNGALRVNTIRELARLRGSRWLHFNVSNVFINARSLLGR